MAEIVVKDHGIEVIEAPDESKISLELLVKTRRGVSVIGDVVLIGDRSPVRYRIVAWDSDTASLRVVKE